MATWTQVAYLYRASSDVNWTHRYFEIDSETTELNDDPSKGILYNGYFISKSMAYDGGSRGGIFIFIVKDTPNSSYIRLRVDDYDPQYDEIIYYEPNYTGNGVKAYIVDYTDPVSSKVVPATRGNMGASMTTSAVVYSDKVTKVTDIDAYLDSMTFPTGKGGGATHIAKRTGQLSTLSSYTSDILIVSGGGGGGTIIGASVLNGKDAGGISGSGDNSADQTTGNAFGLGESGSRVSGGGSGLYGGYKGTSSKSGGAGSGYIGNSLLSNKKMVGYNVPTSSAEGTKTESVNVFDNDYAVDKPKAGNGHARIKYLSQ